MPERILPRTWHDPKEWGIWFFEFAERDPHVLQSSREQDVDDCPAVDQHLLESGVAEYGVHQQRILAWLVKIEPLICPTERDWLMGPIIRLCGSEVAALIRRSSSFYCRLLAWAPCPPRMKLTSLLTSGKR